jgi:DNA-binding NarL/FixJ family response regulator
VPAPRLVGREAQLAAVSGLVEELSQGRGGVLWIDGEPGMGKTALVDALAASAGRRGAIVLRAAGDEMMADFPLRLMAGCLGVSRRAADPALVRIAALLRGGADHAEDPLSAAQEQLFAVVERLCAQGPVLLAAEDLQWSDEPSLALWGRLARTAERSPLLLVGTARPAPRRDPVDRLRELVSESGPEGTAGGARVLLDLPPLEDGDAARLAEQVAGALPGPRLRRELARAGGNPLYIRSLVNALRGDGLVALARSGAAEFTGPAGATPDALADLIGRRLGFLPGEIISMLRLAALLGERFDPAQLAAVAAAEAGSVLRAVDAAERAGVLRAGEQPAFCNELVRQVLTRQIPSSVRRTLHGHIARTLVQLGGSDEAVVRHLHAAGAELDAWAVGWLTRVPQSALDAVPADAVPLLRRAMRIVEHASEPTDAARENWQDLATRLPGVLFLDGRDEEAVELAQLLADSVEDPELAARMTELAARAVLRTGRWGEVVEMAGMAFADEAFPPLWRARLRALSSLALSQLSDPKRARAAAAEAVHEAGAVGDPLTVALAYHAASLSASPASALEHNSAALAVLVGTDPESADLRFALTTNRMIWVYEQGDHAEYHSLLNRLRRLGESLNSMRASMMLLRAALIAHLGGDWDEALALLEELDPEQLPPPEAVRLHSLGAVIHAHRGEREQAAVALSAAEQVMEQWSSADAPNSPLAVARAAVAEANGEPERALEQLTALVGAPGKDSALRDDQAPVLVRLALAAQERALALSVTEALERKAAAEPSPRRAALARWCRGQVDDDPRELLAVAETMAEASWPFDSAGARQDAAVRFAAGGEDREPDAERARAALNAAVRQYAQLRAEWDIRRADAGVRAHGVRRGPRSAHRRETTGWAALTASEQRIARLVGQGRSNPDIAAELMLSRHTVQKHVSNILTKLQLGSRIEVVRVVAEERRGAQLVPRTGGLDSSRPRC